MSSECLRYPSSLQPSRFDRYLAKMLNAHVLVEVLHDIDPFTIGGERDDLESLSAQLGLKGI